MNILGQELGRYYEEVSPMEFYRDIFPEGELDEWGEEPEERHKGKYCGIAVQITQKKTARGKQIVKRYTVTDELDEIDGLIWSNDFCVMAPISYAGKSRNSRNARVMYALCVELDNLKVTKNGQQSGLKELMSQWSEKVHWIPCPTYCVASGTGLHLYYVFEKGIPLFENVVKSLQDYKRQLTTMIWNRKVTTTHTKETIQQESIFQGFRMVGTITKKGDRVQAFRTGERVSIEYMNSFIVPDYLRRHPECQIENIYKSNLSRAEAKEKYPEWYERRVERKEPKGRWTCNRAVYDWWLERIRNEAVVGHRYYCLMMLSIYAIKCDIDQKELEKDCLELMKIFESRTDNDNNHFTEKDVLDALQSFEDKELVTYPINSIANRSGLEIVKNKRNGLKQPQHLEIARAIQEVKDRQRGADWREGNGRPAGASQQREKIRNWRKKHPDGTPKDCIKAKIASKNTVYRWWNEKE